MGVEYVPEAIEDARINSTLNGIGNTVFYAGDMKAVLSDEFIRRNGRPDVIILDPPRAGVDEPVIDVILRAAPERIVYVSCNPATQARDLALMDGAYRVEAVQPVDMFPHTHHVENVVKLVRRWAAPVPGRFLYYRLLFGRYICSTISKTNETYEKMDDFSGGGRIGWGGVRSNPGGFSELYSGDRTFPDGGYAG